MFGVARVQLLAGCRHDYGSPSVAQQGERLNDQQVVLVLPELIGQEHIVRGQSIRVRNGTCIGRRGQAGGGHGKLHGVGAAYGGRVISLAGQTRIFTAQHDGAATRHLGAKTQLTLPVAGTRKQMGQNAMLEIRNPRDRGNTQARAEELCRLKHHLDAMQAKQRSHPHVAAHNQADRNRARLA